MSNMSSFIVQYQLSFLFILLSLFLTTGFLMYYLSPIEHPNKKEREETQANNNNNNTNPDGRSTGRKDGKSLFSFWYGSNGFIVSSMSLLNFIIFYIATMYILATLPSFYQKIVKLHGMLNTFNRFIIKADASLTTFSENNNDN